MEYFKPLDRRKGSEFIIIITVLCDIFIILGSIYLDDYLLNIFLRIFLVAFNTYQFYNIMIFLTLEYSMDEEALYIISLFGLKKSKLPFEKIEAYNKARGNINAIRLSGYGKKDFAIGKCFFKNLGFVNMYVTSNEDIFYLKDNEEVYGVSPQDYKSFEDKLISKGITMGEWSPEKTKPVRLYKDNHFNIPLILSIIIITFFTLQPIILYYKNLLPSSMPLSFNIKFQPTVIGTSRDFLFKQMSYSAFNVAILLCMYFAANFSAKHHKKSSYKYLYISLAIAAIFLLIQQRIISKVI